jgi:DEAD/DEAH box helicase domain-containing protein
MRSFVESLRRDPRLGRHLVYVGSAPAQPARYARPEAGLSDEARLACRALGIDSLYEHQARCADLVAEGRNVLLATPTASGKTLAYLLAFLAMRRENPDARAVFVYPLKALARDQLGAVRRFLAPLGLEGERAAAVYDGDTAEATRRKVRRSPPAVLLTNPDMLHLGIVPSHETWARFLENLALVGVDEAHVYRGVFGAHVHHVLRRLIRVARLHGGRPRLVAGSATIGAPQSFIETLTGEPFEVVSRSGAPTTTRHVVFFAPDAVSPYTVATRAMARAIRAGHKTIAFTKARRITELMHQWLRRQEPELASRVASYRAGYLPEERRDIERRLFSDRLAGVVSTSALEAGIDVGGLDVCVLVGYPGSLARAWQRIGRAGRSDRESLAVLVAMPDALDRFVVRHPELFFSGEFEEVVLDPDNDAIADAHLVAAGAEHSLDPDDARLLGGGKGEARVQRLVQSGRLVEAHGEERWFSTRRRPQRDIALRAAGTPYSLRLAGSGRHLGTLDEGRAWFEGHPGAIYLHAGQTFRVLSLDRDERLVTMEAADVDYFTQTFARKETEILETFDERQLGDARLVRGRLRVTTQIEGYAKRRLYTQEEISRHEIPDVPPLVLETVGFWASFPRALLHDLVARERHPAGSLHALEHATIGLFPLLAICDRWDLGGISYAQHPQLGAPAVFVYDGFAGGLGLAKTGWERADELFERTLRHVSECPCEDGCPSCVISPKCGSGNHPLDKGGAVEVLEVLAGRRSIEGRGASEGDVDAALSRHRRVAHPGVRGGDVPMELRGAAGAGGAGERRTEEGEPSNGEGFAWPADLPRPERLLAQDEGRWLFFDLETLRSAEDVGGWHRIADMGLALGVTLDASTGTFRTWGADDAEALVDELVAADRVVGFNLDRFDIEVLAGLVGPRVREARTLDMLGVIRESIGFRLKLAHLGEVTLGAGKSADGLQSLAWVREGRMDLVERYCRDDVALTAALWAYGRENGYVLFRSREGLTGRIRVSW